MTTDSPTNAPVVYNGTHYIAKFKASANLTVGSAPAQVAADYLVVGGGGAGGYSVGGGGGAGGYQTSFPGGTKTNLSTGVTNITIGAGATYNTSAQQTFATSVGNAGNASEFNQIVSDGGGSGGAYISSGCSSPAQYAYHGRGAPGGSGGGGGGQPGPFTSNGGYYSFGVGGVAQGNNGGRGNYICAGTSPSVPGANCNAGGGGGAGGVGVTPGWWGSYTACGGTGGSGAANSITGAAVTYAGGGGGRPGASGGPGGGGSATQAYPAMNGTANLGGGGAGGNNPSGYSGGGGSGIVIIRTPGPSGPSITLAPGSNVKTTSPGPDGAATISTFNVTGTLTIS